MSIYEAAGHTGLGRRLWINYDSLAPVNGRLAHPWTCPDGVTAVALELDGLQLQSDVLSTGPLALRLVSSSQVTTVHSSQFTPTSTRTDVATASVSVTPGTQYWIHIVVHIDGQAQSSFLCDRFRLRPVTVSAGSIFAKPFRRIDAHPSILHGSVEERTESPSIYTTPRNPRASALASMRIKTNARKIAVEVFDTVNRGLTDRGLPSVFVDGQPLDPPLDVDLDKVGYHELDIPAGQRGNREIAAYSGPQLYTALPQPGREHRGCFLCGLYVPASAQAEIVQPPPPRPDVALGDSKMTYYVTYPGSNGPHRQLEERGMQFITHAAGGWYLYAITGPTVADASCTAIARELTRHNPARIWLQIGRNDLNANYFGDNQDLADQIGNVADECHRLCPDAQIIIPTVTTETSDVAQIGGATFDSFRVLQRALVTGREDFVQIQEWAYLNTKAEAPDFTVDGVHGNDELFELQTSVMLGEPFPYTPLRIASCAAWWEADALVGGGAMSSTTSSGTSPPAATLTGTAAFACRARVEIHGAGIPPAALARYMIDGHTWEQSEMATGASLALGDTGISLTMPTGVTYPNNAVYTASVRPQSWGDLTGNGRNIGVESAAYAGTYELAAQNNKPGILWTPTNGMRILALNIPAPYAVAFVGKHTTQSSVRAFIGKQQVGDGLVFYTPTATTVAINDGTSQLNATVGATVYHVYFLIINGASSAIYVDGAQAVTGTLANNPLVSMWFGADRANGWPSDGGMLAAALFTAIPTVDQITRLTHYWRNKYNF